jgi:hypothetical protein
MYIQYHFYQEFAGTAGSGTYQYRFPTGFTVNTTNITLSSVLSASGTQVGHGEVRRLGTANNICTVYLSNQANVGLGMLIQIGSNPQSPTNYSYANANFAFDFDAMVPLS